MMHTKHVIVDGRWSVIGSANMDIRSKELNMENVLGILDATFAAAELEATFARTSRRRRRSVSTNGAGAAARRESSNASAPCLPSSIELGC